MINTNVKQAAEEFSKVDLTNVRSVAISFMTLDGQVQQMGVGAFADLIVMNEMGKSIAVNSMLSQGEIQTKPQTEKTPV